MSCLILLFIFLKRSRCFLLDASFFCNTDFIKLKMASGLRLKLAHLFYFFWDVAKVLENYLYETQTLLNRKLFENKSI